MFEALPLPTERITSIANLSAATSLICLVLLSLLWELWLAPLHVGGSWLVLKALPLLCAMFGILRANRYTHQWTSMLALAYFAEGVVRVWSETGTSHRLAMVEITLALVLFSGCLTYARLAHKIPPSTPSGK